MKFFSFYALLLALALAWNGCDTGESPSAPDPGQQAEIAAKSAEKKGDVSIEKLKRPRSISLADGAVMEKSVFVFFEEGSDAQYRDEEGSLKSEQDQCADCGNKCYAFWAKGARWKTTEPYALDASGSGLKQKVVATSVAAGLGAWDQEVAFDIFGAPGDPLQVDGADDDAPDGKNEVLFAGIADPGIIAVTIVWSISKGSPSSRQLLEWDLVFNTNVPWGYAGGTDETGLGDTGVMDLLNIATHEAGHAAGMDHPAKKCTEETMYPFAEQGETKKRTLHTGDIQGIKELYEN